MGLRLGRLLLQVELAAHEEGTTACDASQDLRSEAGYGIRAESAAASPRGAGMVRVMW